MLIFLIACGASKDTGAQDSGVDDSGPDDTADSAAPAACAEPTDICADGACAVDLTMTSYTLSGQLTWNGAPLPDAAGTTDGWLMATDPVSGRTYTEVQDGPAYSLVVPPGTWDIAWQGASYTLPFQGMFVDLAAGIDIRADTTRDLAFTSYRLSGSLTYNGTPLPDAEGGADWALVATEYTSGRVYTAEQDGPSFQLDLPPGTYDLVYRGDAPSGPFAGAYVPLDTNVAVTADTSMTLVMASYTIQGDITWNGVALENPTGTPDAWILATDVTTGLDYRTTVEAGGYAVTVPPGTYDLTWEGVAPSLPFQGDDVPIAAGLAVDHDVDLTLALTSYRLSGNVTWNGTPLPDGAWTLLATDPTTTTTLAAPQTGAAYEVTLPPGTWDLRYTNSDDALPFAGASVRVAAGIPLAHDTNTDLALTSYTLSGTLTANGVLLDNPAGDTDWSLTATDVSTGDVFVELQDGPDVHILLPPGTYDLAYVGVSSQVPFPGATVPLEAALAVTADTTVDLALTSYPVAAHLAYNGVPFTGDWALAFTDAFTTFTVQTSGPDVTLDVPPGVYAADYVNVAPSAPFPGGVVALAGCLEVGR